MRGRLYTNDEAWTNAPVAVVDQRTADLLWPGQEPLGRTIRDGQTAARSLRAVVGVVRTVNASPNPDRARTGTAFVPFDPSSRAGDSMVVAGTVTAQFTDAVKRIAKELEPRATARVAQINAFERTLGQPKLLARLLGALGGLALLLTLTGIYGVVSHAVAARTSEIGIRMALGATATRVRGMVLREALQPALVGVVAGLVFSVWWTRSLSSLLFDLQPNDPLAFSVTAVLVLAVVALASGLPARRASRVDPVVALRAE